MSRNIVVTAGDVHKEAENMTSAAVILWLIGLFSDTWYIEYPMFFLSIMGFIVSVSYHNVASNTIDKEVSK